MVAALRRRVQAWWLARLRPAERWTLTQRNVYILPTRAGLAFGLTLVLLLLASINYQLNLGYALTFLLAGSAVASMHMTHGSLRGLSLHLRPPSPCHAGEALNLELVISNPGAARHGLGLSLAQASRHEAPAWAEVPARGQAAVNVRCEMPQRGLQPLPLLRVESRFPFGLFRAWSVWRPAGEAWVYPALEHPPAELPPPQALPGGGRSVSASSGGEFDGVRPWRRGDGQRQVVWKKVARSGELVSRETQTAVHHQLWLDLADTRLREPEARLSRLATWALQAERQGLLWGLRLPTLTLPPGQGAPHLQAALQALARWPQ